MMKINSLLVITLFFLTACNIGDKINDAINFSFNNTTEFSIPSAAIINTPIDIPTPDIKSSSQQAFENNNTSASLVKEITLEKLTLTITNPSSRDFSFLKSIQIYISTNNNNEVLLAENMDIGANPASPLSLETQGVNLKQYVTEDSYNLRYEVVTKEATGSATDIKADMTFKVTADLL